MSTKTSLDRLIYMVNQIARNVATEEDPAAATAAHIQRYWDPRMKAMIVAYSGNELSPNGAAAVAQLGR